ncbi:endothelin-converting enzyme homolog [Zerene cesonia]|uniref:endothelin-converting enzyme homolog n=1 Tax=Zerene cesonia TaxID=33412 RepID=UPI0018E4FF92|nr:endothelin-converting enzyme homolog [Zerene cesonia]
MNAWPNEEGDGMGPTVTRTNSAKVQTPTLKNGSDLRETGYLIAVGSRTARFRRKHKNKMLLICLLILLLLLLSLFITMTVLYVKQRRHKTERVCDSKECLRSAANLALSMDLNVNPCSDFYQYVCGNWAEEHPRPDAYRSYDWFREKQTKVYTLVRDFLNKNTSDQPKPVQQAKDVYTACMDTDKLDKRGLKPVLKVLENLGLPSYPTYLNLTDVDYSAFTFDWVEAVINIKTQLGMDVLIGFDIITDPKNSSVYRLIMGTPETTNPFPSMYTERKTHGSKHPHKSHNLFDKLKPEFYNKAENSNNKDIDEDKEAEIYQLFYAHLIKQFALETDEGKRSNLTEVELEQNALLAATEYYSVYYDLSLLESDNTTNIDEDNFLNIPNYKVDYLQKYTDSVVKTNNRTAIPIWRRYLEGVFNISEVRLDFKKDKILISDPDLTYMAAMAAYTAMISPVVIELYIWIKVVEVLALHTTTELSALYERTSIELQTGHVTSSRSLQCANVVNDMLGMAVSYAIADQNFFNVTKPKIETMLHELKNALAHLIGMTKWMDDDTKLATYRKIVEMKTLIGFPDWLLEEGRLDAYYKGLDIDTGKHLENLINIVQVKTKKALNKFRLGNNYTWATVPTEVNAYHTFQENTITVPLVMLQHPFFDLGLDSLNYGSLGAVLGHEITHGFDNFGRQFDKNGNLLPWWSNATVEAYVNKTQCFINQYSSYYIPQIKKHVDGKKTLGENIADNGGVKEAFVALKEHLRRVGPEPKLPGFEHFSSEQLFFMSYGNLWCGVSTPEALKSDLEDEHAPQHLRARGALQNYDQFARAFQCPPGSMMNPSKRCVIF